MPSHYRSPYGYSYFNPTGKEQAALTIGSLLAGVLAASAGQSRGDAIRKGIAGTMAGYGSGYKTYQELMGDAFGRDLQEKGYGQRVKEYEDTMGLNREKFAEEKRQYAETKKPIDENKIRDERTLRRLDIKLKQKDLAGGGEKTTQQLLEEAINEGNVPANQKAITATNPTTKERAISYDGGVTWQQLK